MVWGGGAVTLPHRDGIVREVSGCQTRVLFVRAWLALGCVNRSTTPPRLEAIPPRPGKTQSTVQNLVTFVTPSGVAPTVGAVAKGSSADDKVAWHWQPPASEASLQRDNNNDGAVASSAALGGVDGDSRRLEDCIVHVTNPEGRSPAGHASDTAGSSTQATRYVW